MTVEARSKHHEGPAMTTLRIIVPAPTDATSSNANGHFP